MTYNIHNMKNIISIIILTITVGVSGLIAQDIITNKNGEEIQAKIIRVSDTEIIYKKWSNMEGPEFVMPNSDVFMIKYQNGEKEVFKSNVPETKNKNEIEMPFRKNSVFAEVGGLGYFISVNYERRFGNSRNNNFAAWRAGVSPMGSIGTLSTAVSYNIGSKTDFFEVGVGGGYYYGLNNKNDQNVNYPYFTPTIGYRHLSRSGFMFKTFLSMLSIRQLNYNRYNYNYYQTPTISYYFYPYVGFCLGYSF